MAPDQCLDSQQVRMSRKRSRSSSSEDDTLDTVCESQFRFQLKDGKLDVYKKQMSIPTPVDSGKTRVYGVLTQKNKSGEDNILRIAFSSGAEDSNDPLVLSKKEWPMKVKHVAQLLHMKMGSIYDAQGNKHGVPPEQFWSYHASHVEKKLAVFAIATVLHETGFKEKLHYATSRDLKNLELVRWADGRPDFDIHVSRDPCTMCQKFIFTLSTLTRIPIKIKVSPLTQDVYPPPSRRYTKANADLSDEDMDEAEPDTNCENWDGIDDDIREVLELAHETRLGGSKNRRARTSYPPTPGIGEEEWGRTETPATLMSVKDRAPTPHPVARLTREFTEFTSYSYTRIPSVYSPAEAGVYRNTSPESIRYTAGGDTSDLYEYNHVKLETTPDPQRIKDEYGSPVLPPNSQFGNWGDLEDDDDDESIVEISQEDFSRGIRNCDRPVHSIETSDGSEYIPTPAGEPAQVTSTQRALIRDHMCRQRGSPVRKETPASERTEPSFLRQRHKAATGGTVGAAGIPREGIVWLSQEGPRTPAGQRTSSARADCSDVGRTGSYIAEDGGATQKANATTSGYASWETSVRSNSWKAGLVGGRAGLYSPRYMPRYNDDSD